MTSVIPAANGTYRENSSTPKASLGQYTSEDFAALLQPNALSTRNGTPNAVREPLVEYQDKQITTSDLMKIIRSEAVHISELPEDQYQVYVKGQEYQLAAMKRGLEDQYRMRRSTSDLLNDPRLRPYATVTVGGKVIATIDNQGVVGTKNGALGDRINKLIMDGLDAESALPGGPTTAQDRAERIAKLVGGKVIKADTAMTQNSFDALPTYDPRNAPIDYDAMRNDPEYARLQEGYKNLESLKQRRNDYLYGIETQAIDDENVAQLALPQRYVDDTASHGAGLNIEI